MTRDDGVAALAHFLGAPVPTTPAGIAILIDEGEEELLRIWDASDALADWLDVMRDES